MGERASLYETHKYDGVNSPILLVNGWAANVANVCGDDYTKSVGCFACLDGVESIRGLHMQKT